MYEEVDGNGWGVVGIVFFVVNIIFWEAGTYDNRPDSFHLVLHRHFAAGQWRANSGRRVVRIFASTCAGGAGGALPIARQRLVGRTDDADRRALFVEICTFARQLASRRTKYDTKIKI